MDYEEVLLDQYRRKVGVKDYHEYPKSHWPGCNWANPDRPIELPADCPARLISCNACLRRHRYIRVLNCNPRVKGWPYPDRECPQCDYGNDCETWLQVRGIGADVERVLRRFDPDASHSVTWMDTGLLPFHEQGTDTDNLFFDSLVDLDRYCDRLLTGYPNECMFLSSGQEENE